MSTRLLVTTLRVTAALLASAVLLSTNATANAATSWAVAFRGTFAAVKSGTVWQDGHVYGGWRAVFDGYGTTRARDVPERVLSQRPRRSTRPDETHASLVVSRAAWRDLDVTVRLRTVRQLRSGSPANPWEVAWLLWHFTDNQHFYYVVLKRNGWELGKEDPAYPGAQRFLATGRQGFRIGEWNTVRVRQVGEVVTVWANGERLTTFRDRERPYLKGRIGLYNEDAEVQFRRVVVRVRR